MWPFKALINAVPAARGYLSTVGMESILRNILQGRDPNLNLDASGRALARARQIRPQSSPSPTRKASLPESDQVSQGNKIDNHTLNMAASLKPILPYTMYPAVQGRPVHFHVGQAQMPYDVHSLVLSADSPACKTLLARPLKAPIALPTVSPDDFAALTKWLYEHAPPVFDSSADLSSLCKLWVSAMALGLWQKANTLMRLGMVAAMPSDVLCSIDVVRWVFANTPSSSPLRDYIIAIFVQRSKPDRSFLLQHSPVDGEICSKFNAFAKKFQMARHKFAVSKDQGPWGTDENGFPTFDYKKVLALKGEQEPLPLPPYLVWDEKAVELPDCFFIFPGTLTYVEGLAAVLK